MRPIIIFAKYVLAALIFSIIIVHARILKINDGRLTRSCRKPIDELHTIQETYSRENSYVAGAIMSVTFGPHNLPEKGKSGL